ncbi:MAG: dipeptide epimerase [Robiginitomaculum sp.]|nr:MAG: dipeptide epimerase [Robiginitomaculum sp.]
MGKGQELYHLELNTQTWPTAGSFRIAHGSVKEIHVIRVSIGDEKFSGHGECRPYARYAETPQTVTAQILTIADEIKSGISTAALQTRLPAGAARNAVDCALWDLKAKQAGKPVWTLLNTPKPRSRTTAFTLSIDRPEKMAAAAKAAKQYPILKLKIDGPQGLEACLAVLKARPDAQLIIDANEALSPKDLPNFRHALAHAPVLMIEQPLRANEFSPVSYSPDDLPILCADESLHTRADLQKLWTAGYRAVNVKLDKCGGLSEALLLMREAKSMGFLIMAGCMVGTSLAMAPMMVLESFADFIDLDGPLLLAKKCENGIKYEGAIINPPPPELWG